MLSWWWFSCNIWIIMRSFCHCVELSHYSQKWKVNTRLLLLIYQLSNKGQNCYFFLSLSIREDLNQLKMEEKDICAEIKDAEKTVALTKEKCAVIKQRIPEVMAHVKTEKERVTDVVHHFIFKGFIQKYSNSHFFPLLWQILQLKLQIENEMQRNKKLKEKLIALKQDIEKTVSIVTVVSKCLYNLGAALASYVCLDSSLGRAWHITGRLHLDSQLSYAC